MKRCIYLDNNATTPCAPEVTEAMHPFFRSVFGNPSSPHIAGREANKAIDDAREQIAVLIGSDPREIIFTSGATESNNIALLGTARLRSDRKRIVTSAVEHKSILGPCEELRQRGFDVMILPVNTNGVVRLDVAEREINEHTLLVSIQAANNETGVLQPIKELATITHSCGAIMHCDAVQVIGKIPFSISELGVDTASISAHKFYGPKGVGVLAVRRSLLGREVSAIMYGGDQEGGVRPGTLNVPGIVGMGKATAVASRLLEEDMIRIRSIRDAFETELSKVVPVCRFNGVEVSRLPGTTSVTIAGVQADALMANVPDLCVSAGSACTSGTIAPSHVLLAMGLSHNAAECTIRLGFGRYNTHDDAVCAVERLSIAIRRLRE